MLRYHVVCLLHKVLFHYLLLLVSCSSRFINRSFSRCSSYFGYLLNLPLFARLLDELLASSGRVVCAFGVAEQQWFKLA